MAIVGRKATPTAVKMVKGNPGKRPLSTSVPQPRQGPIICPRSVAENPRAAAYWDMYLAEAAPGHLAPIDAPLLARLCLALAYADDAAERVRSETMVLKTATGAPIVNPYLAVVNRQTDIARKLASELSIPPAQRNRFGPHDGGPADDPEAEFFDAPPN